MILKQSRTLFHDDGALIINFILVIAKVQWIDKPRRTRNTFMPTLKCPVVQPCDPPYNCTQGPQVCEGKQTTHLDCIIG